MFAALALLATCSTLAQAMDISTDPDFAAFEHFIKTFRAGIGYNTEIETVGRFGVFKENLRLAEKRNANALKYATPGRKLETHGVTKFMDLTSDEFSAKYKGLRPSKHLNPNRTVLSPAASSAPASSIDWNAEGLLTPIKNQGQCGSCWAFSATEQLESQYYQKYSKLMVLAPQQVVSCDTTCAGCNGGNPIEAWGYISSFGGQEPNVDYPYTSGTTGQSGTCRAKATDVVEDVGASYKLIASAPSQESNMLAQIQESPMSICVDATLWQTYQGGVITSSSGCGTAIDHAVQATGYNAPGNYWIIRNSWGETWGEEGFVWVEYGANVCGVTYQATTVSVDVIEKMKPAEGNLVV